MNTQLATTLKDAACDWALGNLRDGNRIPLVAQEVFYDASPILRFDAVAYSPDGYITVFEIKSSYGDFSSDAKYQHYLRHCNALYFVFPKGTVSHDKVPSRCGILEAEEGSNAQLSLCRPPLARGDYSPSPAIIKAIAFSDFFQRQLANPKTPAAQADRRPPKYSFREIFGSPLAPHVPKELPPDIIITNDVAGPKEVAGQSLDDFLGE